MKTCTSCNKQNSDTTEFCSFCGEKLADPPRVDTDLRQPAKDTSDHQSTNPNAAVNDPQFAQYKNPTVAVILAIIFPGVGQFYNGEPVKGILICLISIATAVIFVGILVYFYGIYDAYVVAAKQKKLWK